MIKQGSAGQLHFFGHVFKPGGGESVISKQSLSSNQNFFAGSVGSCIFGFFGWCFAHYGVKPTAYFMVFGARPLRPCTSDAAFYPDPHAKYKFVFKSSISGVIRGSVVGQVNCVGDAQQQTDDLQCFPLMCGDMLTG